MQRYDFFFRQKVEEGELDAAFQAAEDAINRSWTDLDLIGAVAGLDVVQQASPNLTVQVQGPGVAYDQLGQRIAIAATQNVDCSIDESTLNTAVAAPGNSKWLSVFIEFDRTLTDPRLDGNALTVYYDRAESFVFNVAAGAESVSPTRPALRGDQILLADILLTFGQTTITTGDISTTRRQDAIVISDTPRSIAARTFTAALTQLLGFYNDHVSGTADQHGASALNYGGGAAWADGTTNPSATIEAQLDKIVTDLNSIAGGSSGARKLGIETSSAWADATTIAGTNLRAFIDTIITTLASTTASSSGARKIGIETSSAWADASTIAGTNLRAFIDAIITTLASTTTTSSGARKIGVEVLNNWADGTTNPATSLYGTLVNIVDRLRATTSSDSGAHKLGIDALGNWADSTASVAAGVLRTGIAKIVSDLASSAGSAKVGAAAYAGAGYTLVAGTIQSQLRGIADAMMDVASTQTISGAKTYSSDIKVSGTAEFLYSTARSRTYALSAYQFRPVSGCAYDTVQNRISSSVDFATAVAAIDFVPTGAVISAIRVLVDPGAARSGSNRMTMSVYKRTLTWPTSGGVSAQVGSNVLDDTTAAVQELALTGLSETVDRNAMYSVLVSCGNDGGVHAPDRILAIRVDYTELGPRN